MEKELYIKIKNELIRNKKVDFKTLKKLTSDIIDSFNLNNYVKSIENKSDVNIACYEPDSKKIIYNFDNINSLIEKEENKEIVRIYGFYDTLIHELNHARQQKEMIENNDQLISKFHYDTSKCKTVYSMLHDLNPLEVDANYNAQIEIEKLLANTNNIDNLINDETAANYILSNMFNMYIYNFNMKSPAHYYYQMLGEEYFIDALDYLSLENRIRYGLNASNKEIFSIIERKQKGEEIYKFIKKM